MKTFPFSITSWERDTAHMSPLALGAYITLLVHIYDVENALLPLSLDAIRRLARVDPEDWFGVWEDLEPAFKKTPKGYLQKHADRYLMKHFIYRQNRSEDGARGNDTRWKELREKKKKGKKPTAVKPLDLKEDDRPPDQVPDQVPDPLPDRVPHRSIEFNLKKEGPKEKRAAPLSLDFGLTDDRAKYWSDHVAWKTAADGFEDFQDYHLKTGKKYKDWDAAWRTWTRNEVKFHGEQSSSAGMAI